MNKLLFLMVLVLFMMMVGHDARADRYIRDSSFAKTGVDIPGNTNIANGWVYMRTKQMFVQPDGKIILYSLFLDNNGIEFLRLQPNGIPDSTFGQYGYYRYRPSGAYANSFGQAVLASNGKLYTLITASNTGIAKAMLLCVTSSGTLDAAFGTGGIQTLQPFTQTSLYGIAMQPDGKILVGGSHYASGIPNEYVLMRLNANGSPDNTFGVNGTAANPYSNFVGYTTGAGNITVQEDGKIVLASYIIGYSQGWTYQPLLTVRYKTNGTPDSTFGTNGYNLFKNENNSLFPSYITTDGSNNVYVGGSVVLNPQPTSEPNQFWQKAFMVKLSSTGTLSGGYGSGGISLLRRPYFAIGQPKASSAGVSYLPSFFRQADGKILMATTSDTGATAHFMVLRLKATGGLDSTFCDSGVLHIRRNYRDIANCITQQADGKILVAGATFQRQGGIFFPDSFASICVRIRSLIQAGIPATNWAGSAILHPNPASSSASLQLVLPDAQAVSILLTDAMGRKVWELPMRAFPSGKSEIAIPLDRMVPAQYFYRLIDDKGERLASGSFVRE